jgi:hypothetical protein
MTTRVEIVSAADGLCGKSISFYWSDVFGSMPRLFAFAAKCFILSLEYNWRLIYAL